MPSAARAETVKLHARPDDLAAVKRIPRYWGLIHWYVHDLIAGGASEVGVFLRRRVEPSRCVAKIDGLHKPNVRQRFDRLVDRCDAHFWKLTRDARVDVTHRWVRFVSVKECVDRESLAGHPIAGSSQSLVKSVGWVWFMDLS